MGYARATVDGGRSCKEGDVRRQIMEVGAHHQGQRIVYVQRLSANQKQNQ